MESKEYAWEWVTASKVVARGACDLLFAKLIPSASATSTAVIYNGEDTNGEIVVPFRTAQSRQADFKPPKPIYCRRGLYVACTANVRGVFVQWRELGHEKEG